MKRGRGTYPNSRGVWLLAHFFSQPGRLELVALALRAAKTEAERLAQRGRIRKGPKGEERTRLATTLGVTKKTVSNWIDGEEPSDFNVGRILQYLQGKDGYVNERLEQLIMQDLTLHTDAVSEFVNTLHENREGEPTLIKRRRGTNQERSLTQDAQCSPSASVSSIVGVIPPATTPTNPEPVDSPQRKPRRHHFPNLKELI